LRVRFEAGVRRRPADAFVVLVVFEVRSAAAFDPDPAGARFRRRPPDRWPSELVEVSVPSAVVGVPVPDAAARALGRRRRRRRFAPLVGAAAPPGSSAIRRS